MGSYLFSFAIVPVQEWIAEARRSRDLRAGSALLADLMRCALTFLGDDSSRELTVLLPRWPSGDSTAPQGYGLPNRATGYLDADGDDAVEALFGRLESDVLYAEWARVEAGNLIGGLDPGSLFGARLLAAIQPLRESLPLPDRCPLSLIWAAMPVTDRSTQLRREHLESIDFLFREIKRTRPIRPWPGGRAVPKCNQCGKREAVGPGTNLATWRQWWDELSKHAEVRRGLRIESGEVLCLTCLTKRYHAYADGGRFPSTGEMAARPWLDALTEAKPTEVEALREAARKSLGERDLGRALYLSEQRLKEAEGDAVIEARQELAAAVRSMRSELSTTPPRYLALATFDGDDMGRCVQRHSELATEAMEAFAVNVAERLGTHRGKRFYLAGDEGLVFLPAQEALGFALAVHRCFTAAFHQVPEATLSMGLVFFDQSHPLGAAMTAAREALHRAKRLFGDRRRKDALCVSVVTSSGTRWSYAAHWSVGAWQRVTQAADLVAAGRLAAGWAYDIETYLRGLEAGDWNLPGLRDAARAEVRRLFHRRFSSRRGVDSRELAKQTKEKAWASLDRDLWRDPDDLPSADEFHLLAFLARQRPVHTSDASDPAGGGTAVREDVA